MHVLDVGCSTQPILSRPSSLSMNTGKYFWLRETDEAAPLAGIKRARFGWVSSTPSKDVYLFVLSNPIDKVGRREGRRW